MEVLSCVQTKVKRSKFFGYLIKIESCEEISLAREHVESVNLKARHICYGAICGGERKLGNDGEVGNAGKGLLGVLENNGLEGYVLVVARYYGGVKLGSSGVGRAFRECGKMAVGGWG